jgi:hypothetical protein
MILANSWRIQMFTVSACALLASALQDSAQESRSREFLMAFGARGSAPADAIIRRLAEGTDPCRPVRSVVLRRFSVVAIRCSAAGPLAAEELERKWTKRAENMRLTPLTVANDAGGWRIKTLDVKVLLNGSHEKERVRGMLPGTGFRLSLVRDDSPYRLLLRKRNSTAPSDSDLERLRSALKCDVEQETITIQIDSRRNEP